jgi:hypothetical protein
MTATPRAGSPLSNSLELLGIGVHPKILRYARVKVV